MFQGMFYFFFRELLYLRRHELEGEAAFLSGLLLGRLVTLVDDEAHAEARTELLEAALILMDLSPSEVTG